MKKRHLLYVGPSYSASASRYFVDSFERLGWVITRVGPAFPHHGDIKWDDMPDLDLELPRNSTWHVDDFIDFATRQKGQTVDLCFLIEETYSNDIINTKKIPSVLISLDGWQNSFDRRQVIQPSRAFTPHPLGVACQRQERIPDGWEFLGPGAAPWLHKNHLKPMSERSIDFSLMATPYGERPKICDALRKAGFTVRDGLVGSKEYVEIGNNSLLTYHNCNTQCEVKYRFPEACLAGVVNIADFTTLYSWMGYFPYYHYIPVGIDNDSKWPTLDNFVRVVREAKDNLPLLQAISESAWDVTLSKNTYYHRAKTIALSVDIDIGLSLEEIKIRSVFENGSP